MNLVDAFETLAPIAALERGAACAARNEAAGLIHEELGRLAKRVASRFRMPQADPEDAVQETLLRLCRGGPRTLPAHRRSEETVRAYLFRAIENHYRSLLRRPRVSSGASPEAFETGAPLRRDATAAPAADLDESRELETLLREIRGTVAPRIATGMKPAASPDFLGAVDQVIRLRRREVTFDHLVAECTAAGLSPEDEVRLRDALYQRHFRARRRLIAGIRALHAAGDLGSEMASKLERLVGALGRRG